MDLVPHFFSVIFLIYYRNHTRVDWSYKTKYYLCQSGVRISGGEYIRPKHYRESPNAVEVAEFERASLNMLFFSASSTLFRLSFISLRSVWTCLLIACYIVFDVRLSDIGIPEVSGLTRLALYA